MYLPIIKKIAIALKNKNIDDFDLIIADEAHKCTGFLNSDFGLVLKDNEIKGVNKLFMTATPRTYNQNIKNLSSDRGVEVASMDDESLFGKVLHELYFSEAIKDY